MLIKIFKRRSFKERNAEDFKLGFEKGINSKNGSGKVSSVRKSGGARAAVDYLLGKNRDREGAKLLRGSPELSIKIAEQASRKFQNPYTVGCLAIEEKNLNDEQKKEIMDSFEELVFAGIAPENRNVLWVEHTDKRNLELNFFMPNMELSTGKRFQPYYHIADKKLFADWAKTINKQYELSDPTDPERKQSNQFNKSLPKGVRAIADEVYSYIHKAVERGELQNRKQVIEFINQEFGQFGIQVVRISKQSISINNPDGQRNIRLKGAYYEESFGLSREVKSEKSGDRSTRGSDSPSGKNSFNLEGSTSRKEATAIRAKSGSSGVLQEQQEFSRIDTELRERLYRSYQGRVSKHQEQFKQPKYEGTGRFPIFHERGVASLSKNDVRDDSSRDLWHDEAGQAVLNVQSINPRRDMDVDRDSSVTMRHSSDIWGASMATQNSTSSQSEFKRSKTEPSGVECSSFSEDDTRGRRKDNSLGTNEEQPDLSRERWTREGECVGAEGIVEKLAAQSTPEKSLNQLEREIDEDEWER